MLWLRVESQSNEIPEKFNGPLLQLAPILQASFYDLYEWIHHYVYLNSTSLYRPEISGVLGFFKSFLLPFIVLTTLSSDFNWQIE